MPSAEPPLQGPPPPPPPPGPGGGGGGGAASRRSEDFRDRPRAHVLAVGDPDAPEELAVGRRQLRHRELGFAAAALGHDRVREDRRERLIVRNLEVVPERIVRAGGVPVVHGELRGARGDADVPGWRSQGRHADHDRLLQLEVRRIRPRARVRAVVGPCAPVVRAAGLEAVRQPEARQTLATRDDAFLRVDDVREADVRGDIERHRDGARAVGVRILDDNRHRLIGVLDLLAHPGFDRRRHRDGNPLHRAGDVRTERAGALRGLARGQSDGNGGGHGDSENGRVNLHSQTAPTTMPRAIGSTSREL